MGPQWSHNWVTMEPQWAHNGPQWSLNGPTMGTLWGHHGDIMGPPWGCEVVGPHWGRHGDSALWGRPIGTAVGLVINTGDRTIIGRIASLGMWGHNRDRMGPQ